MGYKDNDDHRGFERHGMNRDNDFQDPSRLADVQQRPHRTGFDRPELERDEDLRTAYSIPLGGRSGRHEAYGSPGDAQRETARQGAPSDPLTNYGAPGARHWEDRDTRYGFGDRLPSQNRDGYPDDTGYGYGSRGPGIGGYDPHDADYRHRQRQTSAGYGNRSPGADRWEGDRDRDRDNGGYGYHGGRSYGYGFDGQPDDGGRQDRYGNGAGGQQSPYRSQREHHDPDYAAWREQQLRALDEDYDSWRKERYQKFSEEFSTWRSSRNQGVQGNPGNQVSSASSKNPAPGTASPSGSTTTPGVGGNAPSGKSKDAG